MNKEARTIFNTIQALITNQDHLLSFNAMIAAFLEADGNPRPEHAPVKSSSAFSRFLNQYDWNTRAIIRAVRNAILKLLWAVYAERRGRRPILEIMIDLTTLAHKTAPKEFVWRYVISTRRANGETIRRWGRRRWRIKAFFKTLKFRFGLDQFGQRVFMKSVIAQEFCGFVVFWL